MNSETVHLIATDPPFNKNRDFHDTPDKIDSKARFSDRWKWDRVVHPNWVDAIKDDCPAVWQVIQASRLAWGEDMAAYLCWLGVRLLEMHRVLREDGSIFLHIDHTAHAWVKALMDGIWGRKQFRNEIVWAYTGPSNTKRWFPRKHDVLLWFSKGEEWTFNIDDVRVPYSKSYVDRFKKSYNEGKGKSRIFASGHDTERNQELAGIGKVPEDWWHEFSPVGRTKENLKFPTQKPIALYSRIIRGCSNAGDVVLDPFCGCATTPVAAERLGRQWVGMDLWDDAHQMVINRLVNEGLAVEGQTRDDQILTLGDVRYSTTPPVRTDDREEAAPILTLKPQRRTERWQRLTHAQMRSILAEAQSDATGRVICAGCGRSLELDFMELDHVLPRTDNGENWITNRILLCGPCNRRKSNSLTLSGLVRQNIKSEWMHDRAKTESAWQRAQARANDVRDAP